MELRIFMNATGCVVRGHSRHRACHRRRRLRRFLRSDHYLKMGDVWPAGANRHVDNARRPRPGHEAGASRHVAQRRHVQVPGVLAISVAEVDAMSGGRVELGLGAGWYDDEHTATASSSPHSGSVSRSSKSSSKSSTVSGRPTSIRRTASPERLHLANSPALPKPVQSPRLRRGFRRRRRRRRARRELRTDVSEFDGGDAVDADVGPILRGAESAAAAGDLFAGNEYVAVEIQGDARGICLAAGAERDYGDGAELGCEAIEECGI